MPIISSSKVTSWTNAKGEVFFHHRLSSVKKVVSFIKGRLPSTVLLSSIYVRLPFTVVFHPRSSSVVFHPQPFSIHVFRPQSSFINSHLPSPVVFYSQLSSICRHLPSASSSIPGHLSSTVVSHPQSSSRCLPPTVVFHPRSSSVKGLLPTKF